jgi:hypothetical protein
MAGSGEIMKTIRKTLTALLTCSALLCAHGCTSQEKYDFYRQVGHEKAQCEYMIDRAEAARCSAQFSLTYEAYLLLQQDLATETENESD